MGAVVVVLKDTLEMRHYLTLIASLVPLVGAVIASAAEKNEMPAFKEGNVILFQGDSITDMNRGRSADPNHVLGHSYAFIIGAKYGAMLPERHLTFINRGVSGNKVNDLAARWKTDTLNLKPDILSILVGVNDLNGGVSAADYQQRYDELLAETVKALPHVRLVLCEPFGLPTGKKKENWDAYHMELLKRQEIVANLATKYHAPLVKLQNVYEDACKRAPADYWIWDGVHPTFSGQQLLADEWVRTVNEFYGDNVATQ